MNREPTKSGAHETREQKERELLKKLELKVEAVKRLKKLMDRFTFDLSREEVIKQVDAFFDEVKEQYPHQVEKMKKVLELRRSVAEIDKDLDDMYQRYGEKKIEDLLNEATERGFANMRISDVGIVTRIRELEQDQDGYQDEIDELEQDQDLMFLVSLHYGIEEMIYRFQEIGRLKEEPKNLAKYCADLLHIPPDQYPAFRRGIEDVEWSPQCITVFLEQKTYEKLVGGESSGVHLSESPVNIVKESGDESDIAETIEHESIHAFLDGFLPRQPSRAKYETDFWMNHLSQRVRTLEKIIDTGLEVGEKQDLSLQIPYFGTLNNFVDSLHEEMVADIDRIEEMNVFADSSRETLLAAFTTAKTRSLDVMTAVKKLEKSAKHPRLAEKLKELFGDIALRLQKIAYQMNYALTMGSELGSREDMEALLVLLKPSRYSHLKRYLEHLHGRETCRETEKKLFDLYDLSKKNAA